MEKEVPRLNFITACALAAVLIVCFMVITFAYCYKD